MNETTKTRTKKIFAKWKLSFTDFKGVCACDQSSNQVLLDLEFKQFGDTCLRKKKLNIKNLNIKSINI